MPTSGLEPALITPTSIFIIIKYSMFDVILGIKYSMHDAILLR